MNAPARPLVFHPKADSELAARLRGAVQGELLFDRASRGRYSTDASIYQIEPIGVLVPRSHDDVRAAVDVCRELGVPLLPRGAGSSQCGQTVGAALVIDHSKHLTGVIAFDREAMTVTVEPGIVLDALNAWLRPHGVWFPVDVSTSAQATLGGMAGNNSCGSRSIAYGNMVHNVLAADVLLVDGTEAWLGAEAKMGSASPRVRALIDGLRAIGERERDEIERRVPKVMRRVGGYNLDVFHPQSERPYTADRSVNLAQLLVGSEGTLAWTRTLTLKLAPLPRHRALGIVSFPDAVPRDGAGAAHRQARPIRCRTRRPHDDRARARQSGVPSDHRQRAGRRARCDPAGGIHGRGRRGAASPSSRSWCS